IDQLFRALEIIDGQIEAKLVEAKANGCLVDGDLVGATPTPCDWSPRYFRNRLQDPYSGTREVDFGECRDRTVGTDLALERMDQLTTLTFLHLPYPPAGPGQTQFCSPGSAQKGLEALLDEPLFNPETGELEVGKQASDSFEIGGDLFGVQFDYNGSWGLQGSSIPLPTSNVSYCGLDAGLNASISVVGKAFYQSVDLVDAGVDVELQQQD
ncbi:unnamed protein product, partial [Laminaria digitata]